MKPDKRIQGIPPVFVQQLRTSQRNDINDLIPDYYYYLLLLPISI